MEALVGYWQQIGLDPKITIIDYAVYTKNNLHTLKTAGDIYLLRISPGADVLGRVELSFMPGSVGALYMDQGVLCNLERRDRQGECGRTPGVCR